MSTSPFPRKNASSAHESVVQPERKPPRPLTSAHSKYVTAVVISLAGIGMFFAALFSACVVDKGAANGSWLALPLPRLLWATTAVLVASSVALMLASVRFRSGTRAEFRLWWIVAAVLGCLFLVGQAWACQQMLRQGIGFATSVSSSFFYLLVASHGACVAAGLIALLLMALRFRRAEAGGAGVKATAIYWNAVVVLWLATFLFMLFQIQGG